MTVPMGQQIRSVRAVGPVLGTGSIKINNGDPIRLGAGEVFDHTFTVPLENPTFVFVATVSYFIEVADSQ